MFGFSFDKRSLILISIVIAVLSILSERLDLYEMIVTLPGILIAISFHEFAHAYVAYKMGDVTPKYQGRVSLNPIKHIDPFGFVLLLTCGFGWGKPVEINPRNFKNSRKGEILVSLAGPLMNFLLSFITAIIIEAMERNHVLFNSNYAGVVYDILGCIFTINVGLGVFNLVPLPPLDGSKILKNFLPYNAKIWFEDNEDLFYILFLVLWVMDRDGKLILPVIIWATDKIDLLVNLIFTLF